MVRARALKIPGGREDPMAGEDPTQHAQGQGRKAMCMEHGERVGAGVRTLGHILRSMGSHWRDWSRAVMLSV